MKFNGYSIKRSYHEDRVWNTGKNLIIEKNGKTCAHSYRLSKAAMVTKDAQQIAQDITQDFHKAASIGAQGFDKYNERFGDLYESAAECKKEFRMHFANALSGLKRLDPEAYAALSN